MSRAYAGASIRRLPGGDFYRKEPSEKPEGKFTNQTNFAKTGSLPRVYETRTKNVISVFKNALAQVLIFLGYIKPTNFQKAEVQDTDPQDPHSFHHVTSRKGYRDLNFPGETKFVVPQNEVRTRPVSDILEEELRDNDAMFGYKNV